MTTGNTPEAPFTEPVSKLSVYPFFQEPITTDVDETAPTHADQQVSPEESPENHAIPHAGKPRNAITHIDPIVLADSAQIFKALDSATRLQIIHLLSQKEHFVYELVETLGSSQPLISQHLRILRKAKIVDCKRDGRLITYSLRCPDVLKIVDLAATACCGKKQKAALKHRA
ncbi:MAG: metalloregulator ArsR/SmtB family transcription factor [Corynebacterium sp.]|nr:metalloregulator ArsR/SmtB family transcription factor [Corynebacterium sp.]